MAIKASATITLSFMVDVKATYRYYKLQASTATAPSKPTAYPPSGWTTTEPSYTTGSTNTLYFVDCTVFTNNTFNYSAVSVSSAYEAAKEAFNKAVAAGNTANSANNKIDNLQIGGRNLLPDTDFGGISKKYTLPDGGVTEGGFMFTPTTQIESKVEYTISLNLRGFANVVFYEINDGGNIPNQIAYKSELSETDYRKVSYKFSVPLECTFKQVYICTKYGTSVAGDWFEIEPKSLKLEKGNKATDWTPAPEDVDSAINAKIASVDVEYYLSTSNTSLSGGAWQTTAPTWVNGKYMWSRTKITNGAGTVTYKPSSNGTCIAGAKGDTGATGATGTGISSITEEYYLSTSKTSQTDGSWTTTPPTWSSGKYIWTRSRIVYTNPSSTVYTTPLCDSSWEAVNEIEVGGRNLWLKTKDYDASAYTGWVDNNNGDRQRTTVPYTHVNGFGVQRISGSWSDVSQRVTIEPNTVYTLSAWIKWESSTATMYFFQNTGTMSGTVVDVGTDDYKRVSVTFNSGDATISTCRFECSSNTPYLIYGLKLEKGTKATDWTPAPEDVDEKIDNIQVGGRNLLLKTKDYSDWVGENGTTIGVLENDVGETSILQVTTNGSSDGDVMLKYSGVTKNEKHLLSFYARNISDNQTISFEPHGGPVYSVQATAEWKKFEVEIVPNADTTHYFFFHNKNNVSIFQLKNVKLEKGTKATDWTPAPEDVDSAIEDAKNEAAKTATNYIYYDTTNGLQIGDKSSGEWTGTRAQITSDSYNILNQNGTELASFGANEVRLGNESKDATISMRKGSLNISNVNKGSFDYTQIGCKGNFDVSSNNYTSDTQYKKGGMLTTVETKNVIEWQNLPSAAWSSLSSYTWNDLNGPAFVTQRGTYFETRLYSEENDYSTENITNGSRISLMSSKETSTNKITSEMELSSDKIRFNGQVILSYMMPVGYIFQWVPTNGGPDLSTADKVAAYYGFGTWEEVSGRFLLGRSGSYGVGSVGGNETHTHTNPSTGTYSGSSGNWNGTSGNWSGTSGNWSGTSGNRSGTSGSTAITVAQMPRHSHSIPYREGSIGGGGTWFTDPGTVNGYGGAVGYTGGGQGHTHSLPSHNHSIPSHNHSIPSHNHSIPSHSHTINHSHSIGNTGSTNSMPPYLSVYIWKRIA